jgi:hypothetical protein
VAAGNRRYRLVIVCVLGFSPVFEDEDEDEKDFPIWVFGQTLTFIPHRRVGRKFIPP